MLTGGVACVRWAGVVRGLGTTAPATGKGGGGRPWGCVVSDG